MAREIMYYRHTVRRNGGLCFSLVAGNHRWRFVDTKNLPELIRRFTDTNLPEPSR